MRVIDQATNLRDLARERQNQWMPGASMSPQMIVVASGKGGVGKSFFSLHLAQSLSAAGDRVLLVDGNLHNPGLHILTNTDPAFPINYWISKAQVVEENALIPLCDNLDLVANNAPVRESTPYPGDFTDLLIELLAPLTAGYRYVIWDTQTGLTPRNLTLLRQADLTILLSITDPTSIIDTYTFIKAAMPYLPEPQFRLVINQFVGQKTGMEAYRNLNLALQHFLEYQIDLLGLIPFDMEVKRASLEQKPLWKFARRSSALRQIRKISSVLHPVRPDEKINQSSIYREASL